VSMLMNFNTKFIGIFIFISLVLCITTVVSAENNSAVQSTVNELTVQTENANSHNDINSTDIINDTDLREEIISNLESNGVNTSVLRAAISVGDNNKAKNILELYKDKLQANPDYVKPEQTEINPGKDNSDSNTIPVKSTPAPSETKSPLSIFTVIIGIGAAICVTLFLKR